jgi:flagellar biogenesis protein FliO
MMQLCRIYSLAMFLALNFIPISLISLEDNPLKNKIMEEEIPLPPSLREHTKQELPREDNFVKEFIKMLMTLGAIITILLLASWLLKRMSNTRIQQINESSEIKILERRSATTKTSVFLLDVRGKQYAVVESHNALLLLPEIPTDEIN